MNTFESKDFSQGWIPSDDAVRGRKSGLLRMENLQLDSYGAVSLTRGTEKINNSQFAGSVHSIFSRQLGSTRFRYVGLSDQSVLRDDGSGNFGTTIISGGGAPAEIKTAFGVAYGNVLIVSGTGRKKDDGTTLTNLGVAAPLTEVGISGGVGGVIGLTDNYDVTALEGTVTTHDSDTFTFDVDDTTFRGNCYHTYGSPRNSMNFGSGHYGSADDLISLNVRIPNTSKFVRLQLVLYFGTPDASPDASPDLTDYYIFEWTQLADQIIKAGSDTWTGLSATRAQFQRIGTDSTKSWDNIGGFQVIAEFTEPVTGVVVGIINANGSTSGPLTGTYEYVQVNVGNNGNYFAKSAHGPKNNTPIGVQNGYVTVLPADPTGLDDQINEVWIYRRKVSGSGGDPSGRFLRIKQLTTDFGTEFADTVSDADAQVINEPLNEFLISIQDSLVSSDIYYMESGYFERTLYMTPREIYQSDPLCPDLVDTRFTIRLSGDDAEINLWMIKTGPKTLLVGTTSDIYELSGDLTLLPDGTQNLAVSPLGIKTPPVQDVVVIFKNTLFYIGTDGLNGLTGAVVENFNGNINLLMTGDDRYGQLATYNNPANRENYSLTVSKGKLFMQVTLSDTSRTIFVYDFKFQYWYQYYLSAAVLFTEEDDTLLAGFADADDFNLRAIDTGTTVDFNGSGQHLLLRTPINDDNLPLNRKDSFTLKLLVDTGGATLQIRLYRDQSASYIDLGNASVSGGVSEISVDIYDTVGVAKNWQLELLCEATNTFKLTQWAIEYIARPKQTLRLRIEPNNFGTASRKRIPAIPFMIDTLGGAVTFTPVIDNTAKTPSTVNTADKEVYNHFFTDDEKGYVIGGYLEADSYFEFYEMVVPRIVEVLPDPCKYFRIPYSNLGTQCRKRVIAIAFVIDTGGSNVTFTPIIDGASQTPSTVNTDGKRTYIHYFTTNVEGTDIQGVLEGESQFEFYGIDLDECISEKMPVPAKRLRIPQENYGTNARKRYSSYKFIINTRGGTVVFTPRVDETDLATLSFATSEKQVVEYFFHDQDVTGINIGGLLTGDNPFEFYGPIVPEDIEKFPDRLEYLTIPQTNFGIPAKKKIRTIPLIINTYGYDVVFTPYVDQVAKTPTTFNTTDKITVFHYFTDDSVFGTDYGGTLAGDHPFEFYQMLKPEEVEILPVAKKLDQVGPIEFMKLGKVLSFRLRVVAVETINYSIVMDGIIVNTGVIDTIHANIDFIYEVKLPKGVTGTIFSIVLSSNSPFNRFYIRVQVNKSGTDTQASWMLFGADPDAKPN